MTIKLVLLDIDGVITDGKVTVDSTGKEYKRYDMRDADAIFQMKRDGLLIGLITGEANELTEYFRARFQPDFFYSGCKDKPQALKEILSTTDLDKSEVCYVGDGKYDLPMMSLVGLSVCPQNAISEVKSLARVVLTSKGGDGCIKELLEYVSK